jgi:XTP/dITP diphosphohydrolase
MPTPPPGLDRIVLASNNRGKLLEFSELLGGLGITLVPQSALGIGEVEETGLTFVENALLKARHAAAASGLPALADDSGLCVDALGGAPGLYSARYAGPGASDADNNAKLLEALDGLPAERRGAHYVCLLVLVRHARDPDPLIADGRWHGRIADAPRGAGGFGYDPLFEVSDDGRTAAELPAAEKHVRSHRGIALRSLWQGLAGISDGGRQTAILSPGERHNIG